MDELPIEVHKAKEGLDLLYLCQGRPFCDSTDLCQIHGDMVFQDDQSKVLNFLLLKLTFLWLEKQPLLSEGSKDLAGDLPVFREGVRVNEDIIHHCLECCRGVTQSEKHDSWFEQPLVSLECGLPLVTFLDLHIVESPAEIKYSEELSITEMG